MGRQNVVVLGASPRPDRISNQAVRRLAEAGHRVLPVHPEAREVAGVPAFRSLEEVPSPVDTVTVYVNARHLEPLAQALVRLKPGRVIFNPGAEAPAVRQVLEGAGISCLEQCTLVMLGAGTF